jgi:hypothetical protein
VETAGGRVHAMIAATPRLRDVEDPERFAPRPLTRPQFLLPTAILVTDLLLRNLAAEHPVDGVESHRVLAFCDAIMLRFSALVMGVHLMVSWPYSTCSADAHGRSRSCR